MIVTPEVIWLSNTLANNFVSLLREQAGCQK